MDYTGDGISDIYNYIRSVLTNKNSASTEKMLKKYGDYSVKTIAIYRTPIEKSIQKIIDKVIDGKPVEYKEVGYDVLFHLYMILELERNGDKVYLLTEKRPHIVWNHKKDLKSGAKDAQYIKLLPPRNIEGDKPTFRQMINCSIMELGDKFNKYRASDNNCQVYILSLTKCLGLHGYDEFILQPVDDVIDKLGILNNLGNIGTDILHFIGRLQGNGYLGGDIGDSATGILSGATQVLGTIAPEAKPIIEASQAVANVIVGIFGARSKLQQQIADHQAIDKKYGSSFKAVVDKYGINSDDVALYAQTFPERIYEYYYIYNIPNVPASGLKYPQNYQDLAIYENTISDQNIHGSNFIAKVVPYASSIGINYYDPKTSVIMQQIQGDKYRLGTTGHY